MNLLLDTQALLWFVLDDPRLSRKAVDKIVALKRVVFVSPASLWEIAIKISLGKYKLPEDFQQFWDKQLYFNDFKLYFHQLAQYGFKIFKFFLDSRFHFSPPLQSLGIFSS